MAPRVAVVSACYGEYDDLSLPHAPQTVDAEWVFVSDESQHVHRSALEGWRRAHEPRPHLHPRMAAKVPKCHPWAYAEADVYVWMDASCRLIRSDALEWILGQTPLAEDGILQFKHPWRDCIMDEAEASAEMPKYVGQPVLQQSAHYLRLGHPRHWGLWATGLIAYVYTPATRRAMLEHGHRWLTEQARWGYQDQVSQPAVLRDLGLEPTALRMPGGGDAPLHGSGYLEWRNHRSVL